MASEETNAPSEVRPPSDMISTNGWSITRGFQTLWDANPNIPRNESIAQTRAVLPNNQVSSLGSLVLLNKEGMVVFTNHQYEPNTTMHAYFFPKTPSLCHSEVEILAVNSTIDLAFGKLKDKSVIEHCSLSPVTLERTNYSDNLYQKVFAVGYAGMARNALHATEGFGGVLLEQTPHLNTKCKTETGNPAFPGMSGGGLFAPTGGLIGIETIATVKAEAAWSTPSEAILDAYNGLFSNPEAAKEGTGGYRGHANAYGSLKTTDAPPFQGIKVTGLSEQQKKQAVGSCQFNPTDWKMIP